MSSSFHLSKRMPFLQLQVRMPCFTPHQPPTSKKPTTRATPKNQPSLPAESFLQSWSLSANVQYCSIAQPSQPKISAVLLGEPGPGSLAPLASWLAWEYKSSLKCNLNFHFHFILFCFVLFCFVLFCFVLFRFILFNLSLSSGYLVSLSTGIDAAVLQSYSYSYPYFRFHDLTFTCMRAKFAYS
jgi:hypothetical protein